MSSTTIVQKVDQSTYTVGKHVYKIGNCKAHLKKDLVDMATRLHLVFKKKTTNAELCTLLDNHLKKSVAATAPAPAMPQQQQVVVQKEKQKQVQFTSATLAAIAAKKPRLEPHRLFYHNKYYDLKDCKKSLAKITKPDLLTLFGLLKLDVPPKSTTKEKLCEALHKASVVVHQQAQAQQQQKQQQVVQQQTSAPPVAQIMLDGAPLYLKNCASFDEPLLKALVKAVGTSYSKDKGTVCKRIQKKFKSTIHLKASDLGAVKPKPKASKPKKAPTPKAPTPKKTPTPKAPTPKAPTPKTKTTTTSEGPLLPATLKPMTAEEIRQAVRKCLHLTK